MITQNDELYKTKIKSLTEDNIAYKKYKKRIEIATEYIKSKAEYYEITEMCNKGLTPKECDILIEILESDQKPLEIERYNV